MVKPSKSPKPAPNFIKASIIFSAVNLAVSAIAYVIIVLVSRRGGELINDWSALNNFFTIFLTFTAGFSLYYSKTISRIAKDNPEDTESYLISSEKFLNTTVVKYGWIMLGLLLVLAIPLKFLTWYQALLIGVNIYFELWAILYRMYFLGRLEYNKAMLLTVLAAITRFVSIVGLLYLNFGIDSLVIGNLLGSVLALVMSKLYVKHSGVVAKAFDIKKDFLFSVQASLALIITSVLLQAGQVITQGLYVPTDKIALTTITMLNIFGSMLFYGASAFLALFVVNATRSESTSIYKKGLYTVLGVTLLGIAVISILWNPALSILKRDEFRSLLPQFLLYSIFMVLYNMLFVGIQFLISQYKYTEIFKIGGLIAVTMIALVINALLPFTHNSYTVYYTSILIAGGLATFVYSYYLITKKPVQ